MFDLSLKIIRGIKSRFPLPCRKNYNSVSSTNFIGCSLSRLARIFWVALIYFFHTALHLSKIFLNVPSMYLNTSQVGLQRLKLSKTLDLCTVFEKCHSSIVYIIWRDKLTDASFHIYYKHFLILKLSRFQFETSYHKFFGICAQQTKLTKFWNAIGCKRKKLNILQCLLFVTHRLYAKTQKHHTWKTCHTFNHGRRLQGLKTD